jgi:hypothetical protein
MNPKPILWNEEKNLWLKANRGLGFDAIITALNSKDNQILAVIEHPNQKKYPAQKVFVIKIGNYCYNVPFIENAETIFLKTVYPSRISTKHYLKKGESNE